MPANKPEKIFMLWPKNDSYKDFDNEKKIFCGSKICSPPPPPPPPHNFSKGPSLRPLNYRFMWQMSCILLGLKCRYDLMRNDRDVMINWLFAMLLIFSYLLCVDHFFFFLMPFYSPLAAAQLVWPFQVLEHFQILRILFIGNLWGYCGVFI